MSRTLIAHVSLWAANGELVTLAPGDDVPEWAEDRLGEHCFAPEVGSGEDEAAADIDEAEVKAPAKTTDAAPDFTAPAPRRGRPRK